MAEYYTTISKKQVNVLFHASSKIHISENMLSYLYRLASQGSTLARDPSVEDFRKSISTSVGDVLQLSGYKNNIDKTDEAPESGRPDMKDYVKEYKRIEKNIHQAFRQLCAIKTSKELAAIKKELDNERIIPN